jgi:hypothetical protein
MNVNLSSMIVARRVTSPVFSDSAQVFSARLRLSMSVMVVFSVRGERAAPPGTPATASPEASVTAAAATRTRPRLFVAFSMCECLIMCACLSS